MFLDSKIVRSAYLGNQYKKIFDERSLNISEVAEKIGTSQPNLSNALNGRKSFSDKFFTKIGKAIGLTDKQIKEIFKQADIETLKYKYGEDILSSREFSYEELFEMMKEKENLTDEQINMLKVFINGLKNKNN